VPAALVLDDAEQVQGVGLVRLLVQHAAVVQLRLIELPPLVMNEAGLQGRGRIGRHEHSSTGRRYPHSPMLAACCPRRRRVKLLFSE
jgi:hypothetical protein